MTSFAVDADDGWYRSQSKTQQIDGKKENKRKRD